MSRFHSYLNTSISIINTYNGNEPFAGYIKKYFSNNKKYGSKDRKQISHLCYCYFRTGRLLPGISIEEKLLVGLFLCSTVQNEVLSFLKPEWGQQVSLSINEKLHLIDNELSLNNLFPWGDDCSEKLEFKLFAQSLLIQPDFFLRIRPGNERDVKMKLKKAEIEYKSISNSCLSLVNATKIDDFLEIDKEVVIQDYSSQRVAEFFPLNIDNTVRKVWDCCAASGGKSILAKDTLGDIKLTVSDIRENILFNLKKRFAAAGIQNYHSFIADLSKSDQSFKYDPFDLVIADVPCSGSGTWSRTPEQLYYFDSNKIDEYVKLQKSVVDNIVPNIKSGGFLLYITCSIFKKENEMQVNYLEEHHKLKIVKQDLLEGYQLKADSMYAALLQKPL